MYNKSGWYLLDDGQWCHMKGRCERISRSKTDSRMWNWKALPNGYKSTTKSTLRDAKAYVEEHGTDERECVD